MFEKEVMEIRFQMEKCLRPFFVIWKTKVSHITKNSRSMRTGVKGLSHMRVVLGGRASRVKIFVL
jgi:hypothetical protein